MGDQTETPNGEIKEAKEDVQEAKEDVQEAKEDVQEANTPSEVAAAEERLRDAQAVLSARVEILEREINDMKTVHESKADREHNHEMPGELKALHDHIVEIEREESPPNRERWWKRRIG